MENKKTHFKKIIIIGEPAVGKTSLIKKFISGQFSTDYKVSIGTNMFIKEINLDSVRNIKLQIWDIAGQERWTEMRHIYYKGTDGAIIVGDITRKKTFEQIENFWCPDLDKYCENIPKIMLANKEDLVKDISMEELKTYGQKINAKSIIYTSAKLGTNVNKAFKLISELITQNNADKYTKELWEI